MPNVRLSQSRIEALRPRRSPYDVRDAELKGFGVRVLPSGSKRFFIHSQHEGRRIWKTVGDAGGIGQEEARRRDVQRWFASLRATPVAADRSAPILSVIMRQAELYGYRPEGSNPCTGIRRYRREGRERFLSMQELHHLALLDDHETRHPREAAFVRLLLLTGCRKSEIGTLQWSDYRERRLFLRDGKTGPRTVWLSSPARAVLDGLPRKERWVFPSPQRPGPVTTTIFETFWRRVREQAGIGDVRLHDCRHSCASWSSNALFLMILFFSRKTRNHIVT